MRLRRLSSPLLVLTIIVQFTATLAVVEGGLVPYVEKWGIYELDLVKGSVKLIYTSPRKMTTLRLNSAGDAFVFSMRIDEEDDASEEICVVDVDGNGFTRLTDNAHMDVYPAWSPNGSKIAFLSMRGGTLDIYVMDTDGENEALLYDSGFHDADIH